MKKRFLYIFLLVFIVGFLVFAGFFGNFEISLNKIKILNPFTATMAPNSLSSGGSTPGVEEKESENSTTGIEEKGLEVETKAKEPEITLPPAFPKKAVGLVEIQEILDDIVEEIDIISQEIAELVEEVQIVPEEILDETEEPIEEIEEDEEEEEEKEEEEIGQKDEEDICPDGIDVNTASKEELEKITGVGPVIAQRIIEAKPFSSIYDLTRVSGIGEKTLQNIIEQGCAYVEGDTGPGSSGSISVPGNGGGGTSPLPAVTYPEILISEVKIAEKTGDKNVFIELYNPNEIEVDLTNWYIFRNDSSFIAKTLLEGEKIPLKGYFLITRNGAIWENQANVLFDDKTLNEDDKIALKNPNREVVDEISWSQIPSGFSLGRKWDGQNYGDFEIQTPTPKAENSSLPLPQPILEVFPEIMEFSIIEFDTGPKSKIFTISNKGEGILEWDSVIEYDSPFFEGINWLTIEPEFGMVSANTPSEVLAFPDISNLAKGIYTAQIIISAENAEESPKEIEVILTIIEKVLEDTIPPEVIFSLEPVQTSLSFMLSWTATDPMGNATPSGLEVFYLQYGVVSPILPGDAAIVRYQNQTGEWEYWPILGDLNNDQNVNLVDHAILSNYWIGQDCFGPNWCDGADFNKDGQVDNLDLEIFTSHWLGKDIGEVVLDSQKTILNVLGKDGYTYNFQIRAKDRAGNFSEWQEAATTINLPKKILINEIQIAAEEDEKEEFVELYNPNEANIDLTGWYLQRKTKTGSSFSTFAPSKLFSGKIIKAKDYFLIAREDSSFSELADIITDYPLTEDNALALKDPNREIKDKVGWGEAQDFETAPIGNPLPGQSIERRELGIDTDDNKQDFEIIDIPTPTNSKNEG